MRRRRSLLRRSEDSDPMSVVSNLFDVAMVPVLLGMMVGQYACKFVLAALDTPVFYFLTRKSSSSKLAVTEDA